MSGYETLLVDDSNGVRTVVLNRPERHNAMNQRMLDELVDLCGRTNRDNEIRAVLFKGAGKSFSSGYDIAGDDPDREYGETRNKISIDIANMDELTEVWRGVWRLRVPTIAQVHGYCLAGGTDFALHCDMVIVADDAQIGFPAVRVQGVPPSNMWVYHMGPQWTKRLLLTGDRLSGRTAARVGFALESVPADELEGRASALAKRVALVGRDLLEANKRVVNSAVELMGRSFLQQISATGDAVAHLSPDAAEFWSVATSEGLRKALQKRDAPFAPDEAL